MTNSVQVIALAAALAGGGSAQAPGVAPAPSQTPEPVTAPRDPDRPPPGSKSDQALWKKAYDLNAAVIVEQHEAARLTQGAKASGFEERLAAAGKSGAMPPKQADALGARLREKWMANLEAVQRQWPVSKVRVCGYELLNFESAMPPGAASNAQLGDARRGLEECVERAELVLQTVQKANQELEAVMVEIAKALAAIPAKPG